MVYAIDVLMTFRLLCPGTYTVCTQPDAVDERGRVGANIHDSRWSRRLRGTCQETQGLRIRTLPRTFRRSPRHARTKRSAHVDLQYTGA